MNMVTSRFRRDSSFSVQIVLRHQCVAFENLSIRRALPCGKPHRGTLQRCPLGNQLRGSLAGDGIMQLVLYEGIEGLCRLTIFVVIIAALLEDIGYFLIGAALAGANFPDALQQLVKVVLAEGAAVLHQLVVEDEALLNVLLQRLRRPLAEACGLLGVHAVTHGDDGVEVIKIGGLRRKFGNSEFSHTGVFDQFLLLEDVR